MFACTDNLSMDHLIIRLKDKFSNMNIFVWKAMERSPGAECHAF
jgi:hypothetical protein